MRVPLTPADLLPQHGFKRLAKNIRRTWPSTQQITVSQSLEVLARGLGYRDYHDAYQSVDELSDETQVPSEDEVIALLSGAISERLSRDQAITPVTLTIEPLVRSLPLNVLKALSHLPDATSTPETPHQPGRDASTHLGRTLLKMRESRSIERREGMAGKYTWPDRIKPLTPHELFVIKSALVKSGDLRGLALFELLMSGLRLGEIQYGLVSAEGARCPVGKKFTGGAYQLIMSKEVSAYAVASKLGPGSYLFPSKRDPKQPMQSHRISTLIHKWGPDAGLDRKITWLEVRRSISMPETLKELRGMLDRQ
ncbi:site-specific integrase [Pseudomonas sp. S60]|nr:site-specific integrase [Pseudomonas sp. S60]